MFLHDGLTVSKSDFAELSTSIKKIVKQRQPFERMQVTRDFAAELFEYSEFKQDMLKKIPSNEAVSLYRCGPLIDLCRGPHVPHTGTSVCLSCCIFAFWTRIYRHSREGERAPKAHALGLLHHRPIANPTRLMNDSILSQ